MYSFRLPFRHAWHSLVNRLLDYNAENHNMNLHHHENLRWSQFYPDSFYQNHVWVRVINFAWWAHGGWERLETGLFCILQGTPWDRLVLCTGRLDTDLFCVLQGTPWDGIILCFVGDALRQTYSVYWRGRLETDLFCALQWTPWDRLILPCRGCQLPATANLAELITALRRHLGGVELCTHVLTSTLHGSTRSASRPGRFIPDISSLPRHTFSRRLSGSQNQYGRFWGGGEKRKISCS
jgi:hypothetical protein